jgi:hypothetical protein
MSFASLRIHRRPFERKRPCTLATRRRRKGVAGLRSERHIGNDAQHICSTDKPRIIEFPSNCYSFHCASFIPLMLGVVPFYPPFVQEFITRAQLPKLAASLKYLWKLERSRFPLHDGNKIRSAFYIFKFKGISHGCCFSMA